jgi:hypothetical protein
VFSPNAIFKPAKFVLAADFMLVAIVDGNPDYFSWNECDTLNIGFELWLKVRLFPRG